jgi:hypothetical protein
LFRQASREGSTLISQLIAQHLFALHLRLVLNNCPSRNEKKRLKQLDARSPRSGGGLTSTSG